MSASTLVEFEAVRGASSVHPGQWHTDTAPNKPIATMINCVGVLRNFLTDGSVVEEKDIRGSTQFIKVSLNNDNPAVVEGSGPHRDFKKSIWQKIKRTYIAGVNYELVKSHSEFTEVLTGGIEIEEYPHTPGAVSFFKSSWPHRHPPNSLKTNCFFGACPVINPLTSTATSDGKPTTVENYAC